MKKRKIISTIIGIVAQLICLFYIIWWIINLENRSIIIQCVYIIGFGLIFLLWLIMDVIDIMDFIKKEGVREIKIKFTSTGSMLKFIDIANQMSGDITVSYGHIDFDRKSAVAMMNIPINKILTVQINSINPDEEEKFYEMIKEYEIN